MPPHIEGARIDIESTAEEEPFLELSMRGKVGLAAFAYCAYLAACTVRTMPTVPDLHLGINAILLLIAVLGLPPIGLALLAASRGGRAQDLSEHTEIRATQADTQGGPGPQPETGNAPGARVTAPMPTRHVCEVCKRPLHRPSRCKRCGTVLCSKHFPSSNHNCRPTSHPRILRYGILLLIAVVVSGTFILSRERSPKLVWRYDYGTAAAEEATSIIGVGAGGFFVAGESDPALCPAGGEMPEEAYSELDNMCLVKADADGQVIWEKTYRVGFGAHMAPCEEGGFVLLGDCVPGIDQGWYVGEWGRKVCPQLTRMNDDGQILWNRSYEYQDRYYYAHGILSCKDGGLLLVGETTPYYAGGNDIFAWKINDRGEKVWERTYGGEGEDYGSCATSTHDGGFVIAGASNSSGTAGFRGHLLKIDGDGNLVWERSVGILLPLYAFRAFDISSVVEAGNGDLFLVGGTKYRGAGRCDVYLIKTDSQGRELWEKTYGTREFETALCAVEASDGSFIVAGYKRKFGLMKFVDPEYEQEWGQWHSLGDDILIMKIDNEGKVIWQRSYGGKLDRRAHAIIPFGEGEYLLAGFDGGVRGTVKAGECDMHVMRIRDQPWSPIPRYAPYLIAVLLTPVFFRVYSWR